MGKEESVMYKLGVLHSDVQNIMGSLSQMREHDAQSRAAMRQEIATLRDTTDEDLRALERRLETTERFQYRLSIYGSVAATLAAAGFWALQNWSKISELF